MDLAGPKLRTGPLQAGSGGGQDSGPSATRTGGCTARRARMAGSAARGRAVTGPADASLPLPACMAASLQHRQHRATSRMRAARARLLQVVDVDAEGSGPSSARPAYVVPGTALTRQDRREQRDGRGRRRRVCTRGEEPIAAAPGDTLVITRRRTRAGRRTRRREAAC